MQIARLHTRPDADVFENVPFTTVTTDDGTPCTLPVAWIPVANFLAENVFRKNVPVHTQAVDEHGVPGFLRRRAAKGEAVQDETDLRAVLLRLAGGWTYRAWQAGAFDTSADARAFHDEVLHLLLHRVAAPELAIYAMGGTDWAYGWPARDFAVAQGGDTLPVSDINAEAFITRRKDAEALKLAQSIGLRALRLLLGRVMDACDRDAENGFDPEENYALERAINEARAAGLGEAAIEAAVSCARQGYEDPLLPRAPETDALNIDTTLAVPDSFIEAALTGQGWMLHDNGKPQRRASAQELWDTLAEAVWASGAPHIAFTDHAHPVFSGPAPAAFIDVAKCDPATLVHAATIMTVALDTMAQGPHRPVNLSPANLAANLLLSGVAYDSEQGRASAAMTAALLSAAAHRASAALAHSAGPCPGYAALEKQFLKTVQDKIAAFAPESWSGRTARAAPGRCPDAALAKAAQDAWARVHVEGRAAGFRNLHLCAVVEDANAQILLGAETPGLAPLTRITETDGTGAYGRRLVPAAASALKNLGYSAAETDDLSFHAAGHGTLLDAPFINHVTLAAAGFGDDARGAVENALKTAHHIRDAFSPWTLGEDFISDVLGFDEAETNSRDFDLLAALGFDEAGIAAANAYCCGTGTLGGPRLSPLHTGVFETEVSADARLRMQAALETFLSSNAGQSLALPRNATIADVQKTILRGWELGVKSLSLYRDSSSVLHAAAAIRAEKPAPAREANDASLRHGT